MVPYLCGSECDIIMNLDSSCASSTILNSSHSSISSSSTFSYESTSNGGIFNAAVAATTTTSIMNSSCNYVNKKPHKAHDTAWEAIATVRCKEGSVALKHFKLVRRLGSGDIGNVFLCQLRGFGNHLYAMKVVNKQALSYRNKLHRAEMEKQILSMLDHPFLPTLYAHFDASQYSFIVMEYCPGGDLHSLRHRQLDRRFSLRSARFYVAEVLLALEYLHMMGVIFRDLKPENVLVRADGHIMLSDFDLCLRCDVVPTLQNPKIVSQPDKGHRHAQSPPNYHSCLPIVPRNWFLNKKQKTKNKNKNMSANDKCKVQPELVAEPSEIRSRSFVGTHEYLAPEVTSGEGHGSAVDWWTLGVFLFELLYGKTPFKGPNNETTLLNIISQPLKFPQNPTRDLEAWDAAKDLMHKLLTKDPRTRLGSTRGSADIKAHPFFKGINWPLIRSTVPPEIPGLRRTRTSYEKPINNGPEKHTDNNFNKSFYCHRQGCRCN